MKGDLDLPVISRFCGITLKMYLRQKEHNPPHLHAVYGEYYGVFSLYDTEMLEGDMPWKQQKMIMEFIEYYQDILIEMWTSQNFEILPGIR